MIFTATRFENSAVIQCEADNIVMRNDLEKPLHEFLNLEVMCKNERKMPRFPFFSQRVFVDEIIEFFVLEVNLKTQFWVAFENSEKFPTNYLLESPPKSSPKPP